MLSTVHKRVLIGSALVAIGLGVVALTRAQFRESVNALHIALAQPDVLVRSAKLSDLPKDVVQSPLLKGILTDEVVHYYQDHPTRLSLIGTLKRLAFDHPLSLADRLVASAIDAPAELSLWRDGKGRPEYFMLVIQQGLAAQALQQLAKITLPDDQLSVAGEIKGPQGTLKVYALKVNPHRHWLLVASGDTLVVLSDPGMLLEEDLSVARDSHAALAKVLGTPAQEPSPQAAAFGLPIFAGLKQEVAVRGDFLSFGYQPFFPGVDALRFALKTGSSPDWSLGAKLTPEGLKSWQTGAAQLWQSVPRGHAVCVALPMDWALGATVLGGVAQADTLKLFKDLKPVAATCWNTAGGLDAPLLAAQIKRSPQPADDTAIAALLSNVTRKKQGKNSGLPEGLDIAPTQVQVLNKGVPGKLWVRQIPHELGNVRHGQAKVHQVSAVRLGQTVMAAIDLGSLGQAVAVSSKTYPSMADEFKGPGVPIAMVDGALLARLLEAETWATLSPQGTPTFHRVARQLLPARLQAIRALGRVQVSLPDPAFVGTRTGEGDVARSGWVPLAVKASQ